jgi:hypothetical protein
MPMDFRLAAPRAALPLVAALLLAACGEKQARISVACQVTPNKGLNCKMNNLGPDMGSVCFDAVVKCSMGDKVAKICSSPIPPKMAETKAVAALEPPIGLRETCYHAEIRNSKVRTE